MLLHALRLWGWRRALICAPRMSAGTLVATGCLKPVCAACLLFGKYGGNETARLPCTVSQKQNLMPYYSYCFLSVASLATRRFEKKASVTGRGGKAFLTISIIEWCLLTQLSLIYYVWCPFECGYIVTPSRAYFCLSICVLSACSEKCETKGKKNDCWWSSDT